MSYIYLRRGAPPSYYGGRCLFLSASYSTNIHDTGTKYAKQKHQRPAPQILLWLWILRQPSQAYHPNEEHCPYTQQPSPPEPDLLPNRPSPNPSLLPQRLNNRRSYDPLPKPTIRHPSPILESHPRRWIYYRSNQCPFPMTSPTTASKPESTRTQQPQDQVLSQAPADTIRTTQQATDTDARALLRVANRVSVQQPPTTQENRAHRKTGQYELIRDATIIAINPSTSPNCQHNDIQLMRVLNKKTKLTTQQETSTVSSTPVTQSPIPKPITTAKSYPQLITDVLPSEIATYFPSFRKSPTRCNVGSLESTYKQNGQEYEPPWEIPDGQNIRDQINENLDIDLDNIDQYNRSRRAFLEHLFGPQLGDTDISSSEEASTDILRPLIAGPCKDIVMQGLQWKADRQDGYSNTSTTETIKGFLLALFRKFGDDWTFDDDILPFCVETFKQLLEELCCCLKSWYEWQCYDVETELRPTSASANPGLEAYENGEWAVFSKLKLNKIISVMKALQGDYPSVGALHRIGTDWSNATPGNEDNVEDVCTRISRYLGLFEGRRSSIPQCCDVPKPNPRTDRLRVGVAHSRLYPNCPKP